MAEILKLLQGITTGEMTLTVALVAICSFLIYYFYKEIKALHKEHKQDVVKAHEECAERHAKLYEQYRDDHDKLVKQMFEAFTKNTESNTRLAEAVRDLSTKI